MTQSILLLCTLPVFAAVIMTALLNPQPDTFTRPKILELALLFIITILVNVFVLFTTGLNFYRKCYMLLIQLPIFIGFWIISEYRGIKLVFTLFTTVVLCTLPVELVVLTRILTHGNPFSMAAVLLGAYSLTLIFVIRFLRPRYLFTLKYGESRLFWKFCLIPVLYYLYGYLHTGYNFTNIHTLDRFLINRIPELIMLVFYLILPDIFKTTCEKQFLENRRDIMQMQLASANDQIEQLREIQRQSDIYRHDLRHHMNYLGSCLVENKIDEAAAYIQQISEKINHLSIIRYCGNEAVNLILTSYADKARNRGISMDIRVSGIDFSRFQITDVCSLLSNGLENALKASENAVPDKLIRLQMFEKNKRLCLKLSNTFREPPVLKNEIPVTCQEGHGIGVKSMVYVIEKYQGIYRFSIEDNLFVFQMSM